jgi:hypothetical protein
MNLKITLTIGFLAISCLAADQPGMSIGGPRLGYAFDPGIHALRPILGIAGASVLGEPLDAGFAIQDAAIDGQRGYALAIDRDSQGAWLIRPDQSIPVTRVPVAGEVEAVYLSPQGVAAALLMRDGRINLVTGMVNAAFVVSELSVEHRLEHRPRALAVSDDGNFVVVAFGQNQPLLVGLDGTRVSLAVPSPTSALAFRPSSSDVLSAGPDNRVWLTQQTAWGPASNQIAGPNDGISTPTAVGFTSEGNVALIANSGNSTIATVDLAIGTISSIRCGCNPIHFERLSTRELFGLNDPSDQPMYLFDAASRRALFVPPLLTNPRQGQQN